MVEFMSCPCCISQVLLFYVIAALFIIYLSNHIMMKYLPKHQIIQMIITIISYLINIIIICITISIGVLIRYSSIRNYIFSKLMIILSIYPNSLDDIRCNKTGIFNLSGSILEIGPGPGTNFRCWQNNMNITRWVGIEPNIYFKEQILQEALKMNITFPMDIIGLNQDGKLDNIDEIIESFDYVVGTHVLCSVDDMNSIFNLIRTSLKPFGIYYFLEHTIVYDRNDDIYTYVLQQLLEPLINIIGNGCRFKPLWEVINSNTQLPGFNVSLSFINAPVPLQFMIPHIYGYAIKGNSTITL